MIVERLVKKRMCWLFAGASMVFPLEHSMASGFQIFEEGASSSGNAHAGDAARTDDASAEFYNPASMTGIKHTAISMGGAFVQADTVFKAGGTYPSLQQQTTDNDIDGGTNNLIPNFHIVHSLNERTAIGFGVTVPFGLSTEYPVDSDVAIYATTTSISSINLNPSVAYALSPQWSLGVGVDAMRSEAEYDDTALNNDLSGWGYGYNVGVMYQPQPSTHVGISYRSQMSTDLSGNSASIQPSEPTRIASTDIDFPAYTLLSINQHIGQWDLLSTVAYTQWSSIDTLQLDNTGLGADPGDTITVPQNYSNTWLFALGANYTLNSKWLLRSGVGFDQTPTQDGERDIRMPDSDRWTVGSGVSYMPTQRSKFDLAYQHIFMKTADIDATIDISAFPSESISGESDTSANVISLQYSYQFS